MTQLSVPARPTVTPPEGLTTPQVDERVSRGETNVVVRRAGRRTVDIIKANVFTRINAILGVLLIIVLSTGSIINGAFGLLIIANSAIGIIQEMRAKKTLESLSILNESMPRVVRDGAVNKLAQADIVIDDLVDLGPGDQLVVDGIVRTADGLKVDESMLTGESDPVIKNPGDPVLSGSFVKAGSGRYQASAIGREAYSAKLIEEAGRFTLSGSQLQDGINRILKIITWLLIPTGALTIYTQLVRSGEGIRNAILAMVAAIVPMVPEGLVLMTTIAFAVGVVRLGKHKALINELPAIEGLARVDTVCTDKTGTLTENAMVVDHVDAFDEAEASTIDGALAAMAAADEHPNDTMQAIASYVGSHEIAPCGAVSSEIEFDSARKWSGVATDAGDFVLGAPDVLLSAGDRALDAIDGYLNEGLRVLAVAQATKGLDQVSATVDHPGCDTLAPLGCVVVKQKIRDDAAATLAYFEREYVAVSVISGDNAKSVGAVAGELGIVDRASLSDSSVVVDARTLPPATTPEFSHAVEQGRVFGRVTPEQKRDMVVALKKAGHSVAMTGDGVNDVLALKNASIGVAMGSGAPAARGVSQVVLLDNSFATLPLVVAEGRKVIGNIERVANLFLTKTIYSIVLALVIGVWGIQFPFQPIHVTMVGWFTIGIPAFVLSLAPNHDRARDGFVRRVLFLALPSGLIIGVITVLFWITYDPGANAGPAFKQAATATLSCMLIMALWVLVVVARPYKWWKIGLLVISVNAYVLLFLLPITAHILLLDISDTALMATALAWGGLGCVLIEAWWWLSHRITKVPARVIDRVPDEPVAA